MEAAMSRYTALVSILLHGHSIEHCWCEICAQVWAHCVCFLKQYVFGEGVLVYACLCAHFCACACVCTCSCVCVSVCVGVCVRTFGFHILVYLKYDEVFVMSIMHIHALMILDRCFINCETVFCSCVMALDTQSALKIIRLKCSVHLNQIHWNWPVF